jgi:hypothetical protein
MPTVCPDVQARHLALLGQLREEPGDHSADLVGRLTYLRQQLPVGRPVVRGLARGIADRRLLLCS